MKKLFKLLFGSVLILGFSQCGSCKELSYKLQSSTPFSIEKATYVDWVAGVKGGGSGTNVFLIIKNMDSDALEFENIYFRGKKVSVEIKNSTYIGRFKSVLNEREDKVLHSDSQKEFGNQAPKIETEFPFEIENDEAILSYKEKGKLKFYKIKLEKGEERIYR